VTFELYALLAAVLLGLMHLAAASFSFKAQVGNAYTVGARDQGLLPTGVAGRLHRAHVNFLETFPYFAACVLIVRLLDASGGWSQAGCVLYLTGRIAFLPLYGFGVPWARTFSWNIATLGLVLVGIEVLA
jgi:uncharacterized MAPEG superfamily protein